MNNLHKNRNIQDSRFLIRDSVKPRGFTLVELLVDRNPKLPRRKAINGFTLVELLVVIAIIGILASIALVSFNQAQRQARDTQRRSDLKQYQTALEAYASRNGGLYPMYVSFQYLNLICSTPIGVTGICPEDPSYDATARPNWRYRYLSIETVAGVNGLPQAANYVIWTELENSQEATGFWVFCSSGQAGEVEDEPNPTAIRASGNCPL